VSTQVNQRISVVSAAGAEQKALVDFYKAFEVPCMDQRYDRGERQDLTRLPYTLIWLAVLL
jgi:hypothetical protein